MTALEDRLRSLGDALDVGAEDVVVDAVLGRLDEADLTAGVTVDGASGTGQQRVLRVAAVVIAGLALTVAVVPSSRRAVADWLGFDGVRLERQPELQVPVTADPLERGDVGTIEEVDGTDVLVTELDGSIDNPTLGKVLGAGSDVTEVTVDGAFALWIDGAPHELGVLGADGTIEFRRFAGNTLLWQDGATIRRLEGFADVDAAVAYAESLTD